MKGLSLDARAVRRALALLVLAAAAPCAARSQVPAAARSRDHTAADTRFMQGMIGHHAQAIVMSAMAPTHGAGAQLQVLASRILRSQRDEIEVMQGWLVDRGETVPDAADPHAGMDMSMGDHVMLMPGMLSAAQLAELDAARGTAFDRLYLQYMIRHHQGALTMVSELFDAPASGQGAEIFGYASGVDADQRAEIGRMQSMLASIPQQ